MNEKKIYFELIQQIKKYLKKKKELIIYRRGYEENVKLRGNFPDHNPRP